MKKEKTQKLFIELINKQLEPHGITYDDVKDNPTWYMDYGTTVEDEQIFLKHCIKRIKEVLKLNNKRAEQEANWFLLQWGLTTNKDSKIPTRSKKSTKKSKS